MKDEQLVAVKVVLLAVESGLQRVDRKAGMMVAMLVVL
jgi:hypothetical protein